MITIRTVSAGAVVVLYGLACTLACFNTGAAFGCFALASLIAMPFTVVPMIERVSGGMVAGILLTALAIFFPVVGTAIALLIQFGQLVNKLHRFARKVPYFFSFAVLLVALFQVVPAVAGDSNPSVTVASLVVALAAGVGGALLFLLLAGIGRWFDVPLTTAVFFTAGYPGRAARPAGNRERIPNRFPTGSCPVLTQEHENSLKWFPTADPQ